MKEYVEAIRGRYGRASRVEKGRILEEFTEVTDYHRETLVRLLRAKAHGGLGRQRGRLRRVGNRSSRQHRIAETMQRVGLSSGFLSRYPSELSGGQRQRISRARALLLEPRVIIADEPLAGLDPVVSAQILDLLLSLRQAYGLTYLFICHDLSTVSYASDRAAVMYRGKIVEILEGERFGFEALHPYTQVLLGSPDSAVVPDEGARLVDPHGEEGCAFLGRCPRADLLCAESSPSLRGIGAGYLVACHLLKIVRGTSC